MDINGLSSGEPRGAPQVVFGEAWINSLFDYVNSMRASCPRFTNPPDEWLTEGINLLSSDQKLSATGVSAYKVDSSRD